MKPQKTITLRQWLATSIGKRIKVDRNLAVKILGRNPITNQINHNCFDVQSVGVLYRGRASKSREAIMKRFGDSGGRDFILKLIELGWEPAGSKEAFTEDLINYGFAITKTHETTNNN